MKKDIASRTQAGPKNRVKQNYRRVKATDYDEIVEPEDLSTVYMPKIRPSLMVDGYNILNYWSKTLLALQEGGMEDARVALVDELGALAAMRGWTVTVVFDAYKKKRDRDRSYTYDTSDQPHVEVVFTEEGQSADMYVERQTMKLKDAGCPNVMVATGDRLMQSLVSNAGAEVFSPDRIIEEIEISHKEAVMFAESYVRRKKQLLAQSERRRARDHVKTRRNTQMGGEGRGTGRGNDTQQKFNIEDDFL